MQVQIIKAQHDGTCARPASDSALLAGHVVTVTVPALAMSNGLLAIGDEWTELRFASEGDRAHVTVNATPHATASGNGAVNVVS